MEVESNFSISKKDELKINQIFLQKEDKSNILNYSKYFGNQNIKDIQNKNITSKTYQNNIINISLNKDNNNKQNLNINLNNKENPNYLNNYNMINNYYNNINNYTKNINRKINNINNNKIMNIQNQLEGNSGESFNIEIQNKSNINKINFKSNNTKKEY